MNFVLGILGALVGSYLNVLSLRFSPEDGFKASRKGRSHCPYCKKALQWYELVPLVSFLIQGGKCRSCHKRLSLQYPIVELLSALIFILIPWQLGWSPLAALWILIFLILVLITIIDLRFSIIPNTLNLSVVGLGFIAAGLAYFSGDTNPSFLGSYALLFQLGEGNFWVHRLAGVIFALAFFGGIYFFSNGRAMGLGDVKFAAALGVLLGWPDIAVALVLAFIVGSFAALPLIIAGRARMKDALPFGPFIAAGVTLVFFFGYHILNGYFQLFNLH